MAAVYEDNFGYYDLEADPDEAAFFAFVKSQSKPRKCLRCSEPVKLHYYWLTPSRRRNSVWNDSGLSIGAVASYKQTDSHGRLPLSKP